VHQGLIRHIQKVEVARGAVWILEPGRDQHSAFEHEGFAMSGDAQSIKQPFQREPGQNEIEYLPAFLRYVEKACANGSADVSDCCLSFA
jgi:hypothetical protein